MKGEKSGAFKLSSYIYLVWWVCVCDVRCFMPS